MDWFGSFLASRADGHIDDDNDDGTESSLVCPLNLPADIGSSMEYSRIRERMIVGRIYNCSMVIECALSVA